MGRLNASPRSIIERSKLNGIIDMVICGDDSQHRKPHPEVIAPLINGGEIVPERTVVVGDQFVDAEFARNIGSKALVVSRSKNL